MINLHEREQILIKLIEEGLAFNEIAKKLQLSPRTIEFLAAEIKFKREKVKCV